MKIASRSSRLVWVTQGHPFSKKKKKHGMDAYNFDFSDCFWISVERNRTNKGNFALFGYSNFY